MKVLLTTLILMSSSCAVMSQVTFTNYLDSSSTWHIYGEGADGLGWQKSYTTTYFDGDTLINGNYYYKEYRISYDTSYNFFTGITSVDTFYNGPAYMREDNTLKFYSYYEPLNTEFIQWDWQFFINSQLGDYFPSQGCTIDTIDSVALGSQVLGRYHGNVVINFPRYIVEGIGEIGFPCGIGIESNSWMVCYKKQNDSIQFYNLDCGLFPEPQRTSHFTVSIDNLDQKSFTLFPNPMEDVLKISTVGNQIINQVNIIDISGNILINTLNNSSEVTINSAQLPSGMYIVQVASNKHNEYQKVIKL